MNNDKVVNSLVSNAIFAIDDFFETGNERHLTIALQLLRAVLTETRPVETDPPAPAANDPETELRSWVNSHFKNFNYFTENNVRYGTIDNNYICIINRYFQQFCKDKGYNSLTLLRLLEKNGAIKIREKANRHSHNGYYKSKRIGEKVESCVWLVTKRTEEPKC